MTLPKRVHFLGVDFDNGTVDSATEEILSHVRQPFRFIVTPNVHHVVQLHEPGNVLKAKYADAWRVYCDSRVLRGLARLCGLNLTVVTGSDLTAGLIARASDMKLKVAIVGPSASECAILQQRYPGLQISSHTPRMGFIESEADVQRCIEFVAASGTDLTFLAVGMPQQEILAQRLTEHSDARGVGLCIGASIDFLTGKQQRAPRWIQSMGLEWLHRLLSNPRRLARRYLIECPKICPLLIAHVMNSKR
jgi:exopolysaccharide biosynthesis WecB/TagA/CpsF family protein